ncbi:hypothetical protein MMSR116_18320 [Methylobacterium mesophilicum SR1.6/6]|uniref:DUF6602 domain-containing protein n=1 Tax=Methylobacterium mesophilicum SR1.6/6 TaxID=908290 RepID=A0A6B9FPG2_9HYPH|nr:DUF6602 domain-containing protein [Methylobacterium mesophilicum]QGY03626.1 hypothetical protein MMSR116_18320 [Methylobacterium mesophilicum SR1.6/6]
MSEWSLEHLLSGLHERVQQSLASSRRAFGHPGTKGDATEGVWLDLFNTYLPKRYQAAKAHVADSRNAFSDQIDVVIYDRQYTPPIFELHGQTIIPAESVYAVFECKQEINAREVGYAHGKIASVRRLHRTSMPVPWLQGKAEPKTPHRIIGGLLTFESGWSPPLGDTLIEALSDADDDSRIDLGCVAANGLFGCTDQGCGTVTAQGKPATAFLLELIARLQECGTVPMIDVRAYASWLTAP